MVHWPGIFFDNYMLKRQGARLLLHSEFQRLANIDIDSFPQTTSPSITHRPLDITMAEKTVATIISKALEQTPKYSGNTEQDADEWLKELNSKFRMAEITESQALKIIPTFLAGPAKEWFTENSLQFETWGTFKIEFVRTYSSPATKQLASHRLRTRQQRLDEPIIEYYTDVMKLCKVVDPNMTDASKIDHLCHGLKISLMREVLRHTPRTPAEFLEYAKQEEVLDQLVNTSLVTSTHDDVNPTNPSSGYMSSQTQISAVTAPFRPYNEPVYHTSPPHHPEASRSPRRHHNSPSQTRGGT